MHAETTIWLKIDSYAIMQTLTTSAGMLSAGYGIATIRLQIDRQDGHLATLTLKWTDQPVPGQAIPDWQSARFSWTATVRQTRPTR